MANGFNVPSKEDWVWTELGVFAHSYVILKGL